MDSDDGVVLSVRQISQDTATQWALLRRCPFKYEHLVHIIETLEKEHQRPQEQSADEDRCRVQPLKKRRREEGKEADEVADVVFADCV